MPLAVVLHPTPGGRWPEDALAQARDLGAQGVELPADDLDVPALAEAIAAHGLQVAALNAAHTRLLHPDYAERDRAIARLRNAMTDALDLGARGVAFYGHYDTVPVLPDLTPYKSAVELEAELLVKQMRATLTDLAYALGAELYLMPARRETAHLIHRLDQADAILHGTDYHPHLKIALDLGCAAHEETDLPSAVAAFTRRIGYVRADAGSDAQIAALDSLAAHGYDGWIALSGDRDAMAARIAALGSTTRAIRAE